MADMTPGEKAARFLTLGERLVELIKESGLLKPKRRKQRVKRKAKKVKAAAEKHATRKPKAAPAPEAAYDPDED